MSAGNITCFTCITHSDVETAVAKLSSSTQPSMGVPTMVAVDFEWSMDGRSNGKAEVIHIGRETSRNNYECYVFVLNPEMVSQGSPLHRLFRNNNIIKVGYGCSNDILYCFAATGSFPTPYIDLQAVNSLMTGEPPISLSTAAYKTLDFTLPAKPYYIFDKGVKDEEANGMSLDNYSIYKIAEKLLSRTSPAPSAPVQQNSPSLYRLPTPPQTPVREVSVSDHEMEEAREWLESYLDKPNSATIRYRVVNYMSNAYGPWVKKYPDVNVRRNLINSLIDKYFTSRLTM